MPKVEPGEYEVLCRIHGWAVIHVQATSREDAKRKVRQRAEDPEKADWVSWDIDQVTPYQAKLDE